MKIVKVQLKDLKTNLFVRQALNQDHALRLAELIDAGVKLPPILITDQRVVIDGRHRIEGYDLNKVLEVEAEVIHVDSQADMIARAFLANVGGALPPTKEDLEHTVKTMLELGESKKSIAERLKLPMGLARKYVNSVQARMMHAKNERAISAVLNGGMSVAKAVELHGADMAAVKHKLGGGRKPKKGIQEMHRALTQTQKSFGSKNAALLRSLLEKYEDGEVSAKQVQEIIEHLEDLQRGQARNLADWKKRFNGLFKKA